MQLNKAKFIFILDSINEIGISKQIDYDSIYYSGKKCSEWNKMLWELVLNDSAIFGLEIKLYEYYNFCGFLSTINRATLTYNIISQESPVISFNEFEIFLKTIHENDYIQLLNCLENEKIEENFHEYKNLILNIIKSPNNQEDWIFDKYLTQNKNYELPNIIDYRNELLDVRCQGSQGSSYAHSVSCISEWQYKRNYNISEYMSPQFFHNNMENLYYDISNNNEGIYGKNVMKLLKTIGICREKLYPYGLIEDKFKIKESCYLDAKNNKIKGYGKILSLESLKYSLNYNGPCLIVVPVYNHGTQFWINDKDRLFPLGFHAMTIVGYLEDCFIIRNSWGKDWGDKGYCYYYFKDWGSHLEVWTSLDLEDSYIKSEVSKIISESNTKLNLDLELELELEVQVEPNIFIDIDLLDESNPMIPKNKNNCDKCLQFIKDLCIKL